MGLKDRIISSLHGKAADTYGNIRKKYIKNLPPTLLKSDSIIKSINKGKSEKYHSKIKEELMYTIEHYKETESLFNVDKFGHLLNLMLKTNEIHGDVIELGTYKGGTTVIMARFLNRLNSKKKIYTYDTFAGFPYSESGTSSTVKLSTGEIVNKMDLFKDVNLQHVLKKFKKFEIEDRIKTFQGSFEKTLPELVNEKFSLGLVDCDIYESALVCLKYIWPRMTKGGIMVFDDYNTQKDWALKKAVDDFSSENNLTLYQDVMPYFIK